MPSNEPAKKWFDTFQPHSLSKFNDNNINMTITKNMLKICAGMAKVFKKEIVKYVRNLFNVWQNQIYHENVRFIETHSEINVRLRSIEPSFTYADIYIEKQNFNICIPRLLLKLNTLLQAHQILYDNDKLPYFLKDEYSCKNDSSFRNNLDFITSYYRTTQTLVKDLSRSAELKSGTAYLFI